MSNWQSQNENGACVAISSVSTTQLATHRTRKSIRQRQTETDAGLGFRGLFGGFMERAENLFAFRIRNARTVIGDFDFQAVR